MKEFYNIMENKTNRINQLKKAIADLKRRWPAHSVPPAMIHQLDDLEDELTEALANMAANRDQENPPQ